MLGFEILNLSRCVQLHAAADDLNGKAAVGSSLHRFPDIIIRHVVLCEEGAVLHVLESRRVDAAGGVLDEHLHHVHARHFVPVMVQDDAVLPALLQVEFGDYAQRLLSVDDVKAATVIVFAINGIIGAHQHAIDKAPFGVLHSVTADRLAFRGGIGLEVLLYGRQVHEGYALHAAEVVAWIYHGGEHWQVVDSIAFHHTEIRSARLSCHEGERKRGRTSQPGPFAF